MKHVVSPSSVAHLWANQLQSDARVSGNNFYFDCETIYSYGSHFPIARHVKNAQGEAAVLFTERTYSPTTAGHIAITGQACRHLNIITCYSPNSSHDGNFCHWLDEANEQLSKLTNARKPEIYILNIERIKSKVEKYANYFNVEIPELLAKALNVASKEDHYQYSIERAAILKKVEIERQKQEKKQAQQRAKRHKEALKKWLAGETHRLYTHDGKDYLRLNNGRIETTQAVEVPLEIARRLHTAILNKTLKVGDTVLDFTVKTIGKVIEIGCHSFDTDYLIKFGNEIFKPYPVIETSQVN